MAASGTKALAAAVWLSTAWFASPQPASAQPAPQAEVHLTVRTHGGQSSYHVGEVIPLDLVFSCDVPQLYQINTTVSDRNGRVAYDSFLPEPRAGASDPLDLYFRSGGYTAGGAVYSQPLGAAPVVVTLELNEWVRFDQAGDYHVTIRSNRAAVMGQPQRIMPVAAAGPLNLTITAAPPEWQAATLQTALAAVNNPAGRAAAIKTIRYLGTEAAARAMAHGAQDPDFRLGLLSSPARITGRDEMRKLIRDPDTPIDRQFLETVAMLTVPNTPGQHFQDAQTALNRLQQEVSDAVSVKKGAALTATARTALENPRGIPPEERLALTDLLYADFDSLSLNEQAELLRNPNTAPERIIRLALVRKMAQRTQDFAPQQLAEATNFNRIVGDALMQWYEMDPVGARPSIVKEVLQPKPRFSIDVLGILPEKQLPEEEQKILLANFAAVSDTDRVTARNLATLVARYAGAGPEAALLARLDREVAAGICDTQAPLLVWLLRVDPDQAGPRLEKAVKNGTPCRAQLAELGKFQANPVLEKLAVKALDDTDAFTFSDATSYLTDNGSAAVEDVLWSHFEAWNKRWAGHEAQLNAAPQDMRIGQSLFQTLLLMGNGWLMDDAKLSRLASLGIAPGMRQQAAQYMQIWANHPWLIRAAGYGQYQISWYHANSIVAAKRKIQQFPKGSEFRWIMQGLPTDLADFKELAQFAGEHQIRLW